MTHLYLPLIKCEPPKTRDNFSFFFPNAAGGATTPGTKQRCVRCTDELVLPNTGEPTRMLHLNSRRTHTPAAAVFPYRGRLWYVFHFSFFSSTNSKFQNPPRGKMIRSDSPLNQLFPLCGHCFLFFAVKQAKQPVKRPEPVEPTAVVC